MGPALFSLGIRDLVGSIEAPFNAWYLDDGILGGPIETLVQDVRRVLDFRAVSGLDLNPAKCELFAPSLDSEDAAVRELMALLPGCVPVAADSLTLLGSPVFPDGLR